MERRELGASGLLVPVVGLGTWRTFDVYGKEDQAARRELVSLALRLQVRLMDTSPMYGESERVLGAALTGRRDRAIVATKVWSHDLVEGHAQIDRALHYFDGHVDLYQVHNLVRWRDYLPIFERMRASGTVRAIGVTHYQPSTFPDIAEIVRTQHVDAIQIPYHPLQRDVERQLLPLAAQRGVGVIVMRPLGEGHLAWLTPSPEELAPFRRFGCSTWPQVLLKWALSDRRVTAVIPATSDLAHLRENVAAGSPPWFGPHERAKVVRLAERLVG